MSIERTFAMVKPDGVRRSLVGEIVSRFEQKGFKIIALKMMTASPELVGEHYAEHKERPFFGGLVSFLSSGPVVAMCIEGEQVIAEWRRMIYAERIRGEQDSTVGAFDCPDGGQSAPRRERSTTPLQALNLLNSPFIGQQAAFLAERAANEAAGDPSEQVERMFQLTLERSPRPTEREWASELVRTHGLPALARALFNANEFLFVF